VRRGFLQAGNLDQERLIDCIEKGDFEACKRELAATEAIDIARVLQDLPAEQAAVAFRLLPKDLAVQVFDRLDSVQQQQLLEGLTNEGIRVLLEAMPPDERVDLFDEVPAVVARRLLKLLSPEQRKITDSILGYREGTAGRQMTPAFVDLHEEMTVAQALERTRRLAVDRETIYTAYVIDNERHLQGTVSLKDLVLAQPNARVADIMKTTPKSVFTNTDQEEVVRFLRDYDLLAAPVVDRENRLVGIITWDDAAEIAEKEATEDIYRLGAVSAPEEGYFGARVVDVVRRRLVWLFLLIMVNTVTGYIIAGQSALLGEMLILAAFIPLLIDTAGNIGAQTATVVIRGLATAEISLPQMLTIVLREARVGLLAGTLLGAGVLGWAFLMSRKWAVAMIVSVTLIAVATVATVVGATLPFLFRRMKIDPALLSAPLLTTVMDIFGVALYFLVARLVLRI